MTCRENPFRTQLCNLFYQSFLILFLGFLVVKAPCKAASQDPIAFTAGVGANTPLGYTFEALPTAIGIQAEGWLGGMGLLNPNIMQFQVNLGLDFYSVRNQPGLNINMTEIFAGIQIHNGRLFQTFSPFMTGQVGTVMDWMTLPNGVNAVTNTGIALAAQVIPGLDYPITHQFGAVIEMPVKFLFFSNIVTVWSPSISVRMKL